MEHGANYKSTLKIFREQNMPIPPQFQENEERSEPWMNFFLDAFEDLGTDRQHGFTVGPIPRRTLKSFLQEDCKLYGSLYTEFYRVFRSMDQCYLKAVNSKQNG